MDLKTSVETRKQAKKAVGEMASGELKGKTLDVIPEHSIASLRSKMRAPTVGDEQRRRLGGGKERQSHLSLGGGILVLRDEGFFNSPRSMKEVLEEFRARGWHCPPTALSGALKSIVQRHKLRRRKQANQAGRKIFIYSNP